MCEAARAQKDAQGPFPLPDFNPTDPDVSALPEVAAFLEGTADTFETWLDEAQALGEPPSGQEAWADLLAAIETHVQLNAEQIVAARSGDTQTFIADYHEGLATQARLLEAAEAAGVPECSTVDR